MRPSPFSAALLVASLLAAGCSGDDDDRALDGLSTPTFAPADDAGAGGGGTTTSTTGGSDATSSTIDQPGTTTTIDDGDVTPTTRPPQERVTVEDPDDDAVGGIDDDPPPWTDLTRVIMVRQGNAYGVRVQLAGGDAPETSDGESTMNIATFFDTDGDGAIDYEIWANLGPDGWGGAWFDDEDNAAFGEDSNVSIEVEGDEVIILFPDVMLDVPERFRFSVASEYGAVDVLGSSFARRDDVPDDDQSVDFP